MPELTWLTNLQIDTNAFLFLAPFCSQQQNLSPGEMKCSIHSSIHNCYVFLTLCGQDLRRGFQSNCPGSVSSDRSSDKLRYCIKQIFVTCHGVMFSTAFLTEVKQPLKGEKSLNLNKSMSLTCLTEATAEKNNVPTFRHALYLCMVYICQTSYWSSLKRKKVIYEVLDCQNLGDRA